jgi:predicted nucleic acid-binding protein
MIVIADSSPLRYLILIEEVHLLPILYSGILIPPGVAGELSRPHTPAAVRAWMTELPEWVEVRSPHLPLPVFPSELGQGECEAIALAEELGADVLLVDDEAARLEARHRNLTIQGTLGILDLAAEHGYVKMTEAVEKLLRTNFRASRRLIGFFLDRDARRHREESAP